MLSPRLRWKLNQVLARVREFFDSGKQEPKPRICFDCGRLVGAVETVCSHCGANQSKASFSALKRVSLDVIPAENPVTYSLLLANTLFMVIVFLVSMKSGGGPFDVDGRVLYLLGSKSTGEILLLNQYWRWVMPILLHGGIMHFAFNSFVLWQIGPQVEELFGSQRFLYLYLVTGVAGFVASSFWDFFSGASRSVGASGSIFGLIGVLIVYISQGQGFAQEYRASLIRWVIFMLALGLLPIFPTDNAAHIGGLVCGLALGRLVGDHRPRTPSEQFRVNLMGWGSAAVFLWSIVMMILNLPSGPPS